MDKWQQAIDGELVSSHLGVAGDDDNPRELLNKLLAWHQQVAIDPAVSSDAMRLLEKGYEAGWCMAAHWANRQDLMADIGSRAYDKDRAKAFAGLGVQVMGPEDSTTTF